MKPRSLFEAGCGLAMLAGALSVGGRSFGAAPDEPCAERLTAKWSTPAWVETWRAPPIEPDFEIPPQILIE